MLSDVAFLTNLLNDYFWIKPLMISIDVRSLVRKKFKTQS